MPGGWGRCSVRAMCAACVAQGVAYVGGALAGLQVMAARASARRRRGELGGEPSSDTAPLVDRSDESAGPAEAEATPA